MSSIVYFVRAPRYEKLSLKEIRLIQSYLQWRHHCKTSSQYASTTFEKWCGHSLKELPSKDAIMHFVPYFNREHIDDEDDIAGYKCYGIFEQLGRFSKASQFYFWVMNNVLHYTENINEEPYVELSKNQIENLLEACNRVRRYGFNVVKTEACRNDHEQYEIRVNEEVARNILPIMEMNGHLIFPYAYNKHYVNQVLDAIKVLNEILVTTNFDTDTIYFQY